MGKPTKKPSAKIRRYIATHEGKDFREIGRAHV